ncbi:ROK family protein [Selenomonas sp. oral taxon 136]|uniref:ROK family protein n=1 Tax=Selenomonas sp. oral taxon 136 TaxID=713030 RepID=UPI0009005AE2|nr:ROK family protein [Selenomonas sp. oral taxon 136]
MYICIDIGGTDIKYGVMDAAGEFAVHGTLPTEAKAYGGPGIVRKVSDLVRETCGTYDVRGVAISTAGMVDPATGEIVYALEESIPQYRGVNWKAIMRENFDLPASVENDVNCAALGELWKGAGRGASSLFAMTVGTSIGGCLIMDGRVVHGVSRSAGEIAYMRVPGGRLHERCSAAGLVSAVCCANGLPAGSIDGRFVFDLLAKGDPAAQEEVALLIDSLADAITNVVCVVNPERIVLGGGIMAQEAVLRPLLEAALRDRLPPIVDEATTIAFAATQNNAGMLGALYHFLQEQESAIPG